MEDTVQIEVVVDSKTDLGESPTWDARVQRLYFVDINSNNIHYWDATTKSHVVIEAPEMVGTIALTADTNTILAAMQRLLTAQSTLACRTEVRCAVENSIVLYLTAVAPPVVPWLSKMVSSVSLALTTTMLAQDHRPCGCPSQDLWGAAADSP